jgi:hypothetical protein
MGMKGMIVVFVLFAFSLIILNTTLPLWLSSNANLMTLTYILWFVAFALAFAKFGLGG